MSYKNEITRASKSFCGGKFIKGCIIVSTVEGGSNMFRKKQAFSNIILSGNTIVKDIEKISNNVKQLLNYYMKK